MTRRHDTIESYLAALPEDRRVVVEAVRATIEQNIDRGFASGMQYGMPAWFLPLAAYPRGYHCNPRQPVPFASIASQKNHVGIYLFCVYSNPDAKELFVREWRETGCRLDMGAGCVRVRRLDDIPLEVLGRAIRRITVGDFIASYEAGLPASARKQLGRRMRPAHTKRTTRR